MSGCIGPLRRALLATLCLAFGAASAGATAFVPMPIDDLARSSAAVIVGTVHRVDSLERAGRIFTEVTLAIEETVKGKVGTMLTLVEPGGVIGGRREVVFGVPQFAVGELVLLFLAQRPDGSWQTNHLALGAFHIGLDADGMPQAEQAFGPGTLVIASSGAPSVTRLPLAVLLAAARGEPVDPLESRLPDRSTVRQGGFTSPFTLLGNARFFEPDEGRALSFLIDARGDAILGFDAARRAVDQAFAAWTAVGTASIELRDGGLTNDLSLACAGPHKVRFNDPDGEIPPPVSCAGTLGMGGYCTESADRKMFNQTTFQRATRAALTLADGWSGCAVWTECNVAEVATHEIGHAIGLGHSSERQFETDPLFRDATMFFLAHFDGRCASVVTDDVEGVTFIYPSPPPLNITTPSPLPGGVTFQPYHVTLDVAAGTGPFTWTLVDGGFPGLQLSADGTVSGTPRAFGSGFLQIRVTDSKGDSHTRTFDIAVDLDAPTPTPSPSVTPTLGPTCIGDCDGDGSASIDELLTGVAIALGERLLNDCSSLDTNGDSVVTIDELIKAVNAALTGC